MDDKIILTDEEKLERIVEIYVKYEKSFRGYAFKILQDPYKAEDAVHSAFTNILSEIERLYFDNEMQVRVLLLTTIGWYCRNEIRDSDRYVLGCPMSEEERIAVGNPENGYIRYESVMILYELIHQLKKDYAEALLYCALEYNSFEIAKILGIKPATVRKRISRGRACLKKSMKAAGIWDDYDLL